MSFDNAVLKRHFKRQMKPVSAKTDGCSAIYRNAILPDHLADTLPGATTLYEIFEHGVAATKGRGNFLGHREKSGDKWGSFVFESYGAVAQRRLEIGSGLRKLNTELGFDDAPQWGVGIYSVNRADWMLVDLANVSQNLITVALFDTYGPAAVIYVVNHSEMRMIACSGDKVHSVVKSVVPACPKLKAVISMDVIDDLEASKQLADDAGVRLVTLDEVQEAGAADTIAPRPPTPQSIATYCYTSGTTGNPKGAILTHRNFVSVAAGLRSIGVFAGPEDVHISYLPYAHVFERAATATFLYGGCQIGYFRGETSLLFEDINILRPTIFISVPRLLNRVHAAILAKTVDSGSALTAALFNRGLAAKLKAQKAGGLTNTFWDALVFSKIKALLGGRVRFIVSGSAPISANVIALLKAAFSCDLLEGYGSTESTAGSTMTWLGDHTAAGTIGSVLPCCEVKLVDIPEMGYLSTDKPEPRGEICLRGPSIFRGYLKDEAKTKETVDEEGWFRTGDVGKIDKYNRTVIIDRKKSMFKLAQGEYLAPEKIENILGQHECVHQIFIHGESLQAEVVAIVVLEPEPSVKRGIKMGLLPADTVVPAAVLAGEEIPPPLHKLASNKAFTASLLEDLQKLGKQRKLAGFEIARGLHLTAEPMSVENGLLTPTLKAKRNAVQDKFRDEIAEMYKAINSKKSNKTEAAKL